MIVLCVDVLPPDELEKLAEATNVDIADSGYLSVTAGNGIAVETATKGIFVAGCGAGPRGWRCRR